MALTSGVTGFIYVNTGTESTPVWTKVAAQRNLSVDLEQENIDTTTKDSGMFRDFIPSFRTWKVDFDGLVELTDAGYQKCRDLYDSQLTLLCRFVYPDGSTKQGHALITKLGEAMPMDDAFSFTASVQGTGAISEGGA